MEKKSILMVVDKYPATYGHTTVINNISIALEKKGYQVGIAAFEFVKEPQGDEYINWFGLNTGQWLSIPFIFIGFYFMFVFKPKPTVK